MHGSVSLIKEVEVEPGYRIPRITHSKSLHSLLLGWMGLLFTFDYETSKMVKRHVWVARAFANEDFEVGEWKASILGSVKLTEMEFCDASLRYFNVPREVHERYTQLAWKFDYRLPCDAKGVGSFFCRRMTGFWVEELKEEYHRATFGHYLKRDSRYANIFGCDKLDWAEWRKRISVRN